MGLRGRRSKNRGQMDVSEHVDKDYTDDQKKAIVDKAISDLYDQLVINSKNVCTYNSELWADNLLADTLYRFLKRPIDAQWKIFMDGKIERYLTSSMSLSLRSSTSPFYTIYRKPNSKFRELFTDDGGYDYGDVIKDSGEMIERKQLIEELPEYIDKLNFYYKHLIKMYYLEDYKVIEMSKILNINPQSITRDIKRGLKQLKLLLKDRVQDE